jgi:hypothetical protein
LLSAACVVGLARQLLNKIFSYADRWSSAAYLPYLESMKIMADVKKSIQNAGEAVKDTAEKAGHAVKEGAKTAADKAADATKATGKAVKNAGQSLKDSSGK